MKNLFVIIILFIVSDFTTEAHTLPPNNENEVQTAKALQKAGYLNNSLDHWLKSIEIMQRESAKYPGNADLQKILAESYLGLLITCMAKEDKKTFKANADEAKRAFESLGEHAEFEAEALAWQAALYGWKIAFNPIKGMYLGPKSQSILKDAMESNKQSAEAWIRKASSLLFTPEMFGGDPTEAVAHYKKGILLYENQGVSDWKYLDALAWLGQAYANNGQKEKAIATFKKALKLESKFYWVKNILLPKLEKSVQ